MSSRKRPTRAHFFASVNAYVAFLKTQGEKVRIYKRALAAALAGHPNLAIVLTTAREEPPVCAYEVPLAEVILELCEPETPSGVLLPVAREPIIAAKDWLARIALVSSVQSTRTGFFFNIVNPTLLSLALYVGGLDALPALDLCLAAGQLSGPAFRDYAFGFATFNGFEGIGDLLDARRKTYFTDDDVRGDVLRAVAGFNLPPPRPADGAPDAAGPLAWRRRDGAWTLAYIPRDDEPLFVDDAELWTDVGFTPLELALHTSCDHAVAYVAAGWRATLIAPLPCQLEGEPTSLLAVAQTDPLLAIQRFNMYDATFDPFALHARDCLNSEHNRTGRLGDLWIAGYRSDLFATAALRAPGARRALAVPSAEGSAYIKRVCEIENELHARMRLSVFGVLINPAVATPYIRAYFEGRAVKCVSAIAMGLTARERADIERAAPGRWRELVDILEAPLAPTLRRAVAVIRRAHCDYMYRPDGPGYFEARDRFTAACRLWGANPVAEPPPCDGVSDGVSDGVCDGVSGGSGRDLPASEVKRRRLAD